MHLPDFDSVDVAVVFDVKQFNELGLNRASVRAMG
jgi:hypothetical protein